ncbi:lysyl-tRNA synthetase, class 2 [Moraxella cuniculi DSM 21768]|uniref:Lysyl-tRNA synthetase, class 2 n=1 Tax=Moraxella cuniculi DSM 21768 TaxID=1122245 RepID=A0A1N7D6T4_9GAMM|nr:lysyl-tRNA synthetase, class 2 [Moraxella cuniculi DSM 21768]
MDFLIIKTNPKANIMTTTYMPTLSLAHAQKKAQLLSSIRHFFLTKNVLEVTTPILSHAGNTDVYIESVQALFHHHGKKHTGYLHTSPEFAMKRLLASYQVPIYQICQVFRDNEQGGRHNIEFTMLEWYRPKFDLAMLACELEELLAAVFHHPIKLQQLSYADAFEKYAAIHPFSASLTELKSCATHHKIRLDMGVDRQGWLDLLFSHLVEPKLGFEAPTLITDYPPATAALAKISTDNNGHLVASRFELYINGIEIANAYDELANKNELLARFQADNALRAKLNLPTMPIDYNLLNACDDLPACSGIALGIDRLFMVLHNLPDINHAIAIISERA